MNKLFEEIYTKSADFDPYDVHWDRNVDSELVFKDWFEKNKANISQKELEHYSFAVQGAIWSYLHNDCKIKDLPDVGSAEGSKAFAKKIYPYVQAVSEM